MWKQRSFLLKLQISTSTYRTNHSFFKNAPIFSKVAVESALQTAHISRSIQIAAPWSVEDDPVQTCKLTVLPSFWGWTWVHAVDGLSVRFDSNLKFIIIENARFPKSKIVHFWSSSPLSQIHKVPCAESGAGRLAMLYVEVASFGSRPAALGYWNRTSKLNLS